VAQTAGQVASEKRLASRRVGQCPAFDAAPGRPHERVDDIGSPPTLVPDVEAEVTSALGAVDVGHDRVEDGLVVVEQLDVVAG
jgi:hypothetical protein